MKSTTYKNTEDGNELQINISSQTAKLLYSCHFERLIKILRDIKVCVTTIENRLTKKINHSAYLRSLLFWKEQKDSK